MDYSIRKAEHSETPLLPAIELAASQRFREYAVECRLNREVFEQSHSVATLEQACSDKALFVAEVEHQIVGFAFFQSFEGYAHLVEIDVVPAYGRHGIGRSLLEAVIAEGRCRGLRGVTLRTFRDIPFNAPFYERAGFVLAHRDELPVAYDEWTPREEACGLDPSRRCTMILKFC